MSIFIVQQKISATNDFNGAIPTTTPVYSEGIKRYPVDTVGGLFLFDSSPREIRSIELILGGQSAWSVSKKDSEGGEIVILSGTVETSVITTSKDRTLLYEGEEIVVRTTGATGALKCLIAVGRA